MTTEDAKIHQDVENARGDLPGMRGTITSEGSVSDDDDGSCSSSSDSEDDPSSSPLHPDRIRQNARALLESSPDRGSDRRNVGSSSVASATAAGTGYASYHDAAAVRPSSQPPSQFSQYSEGTGGGGANPPWGAASAADGRVTNDDGGGGLTVTDVASLAFTCVAHCLTEGYRAASNYYSEGDRPTTTQYSSPGPSHGRVDGSGAEVYGNVSDVLSSNYNGSGDDGQNRKGGYSDSYQTKAVNDPGDQREVMDRGFPPDATQSSGRDTERLAAQQVTLQKEEWATVSVPSTYQGGRVGNGN